MTDAAQPWEQAGGLSPFDEVVALLREAGQDASSRDRVALATTFSHGEHGWVSETAWHAATRGHHVKREATIGGISRVDLQIDHAAIEFKATFGAWALTPGTDIERASWLGKDIRKLATCTAPALVVVTVAALAEGVTHQRARFGVTHDSLALRSHTPGDVLDAGLDAAQAVLAARCLATTRLTWPEAHVPPTWGTVLLAAVIGATNPQALLPAR